MALNISDRLGPSYMAITILSLCSSTDQITFIIIEIFFNFYFYFHYSHIVHIWSFYLFYLFYLFIYLFIYLFYLLDVNIVNQ